MPISQHHKEMLYTALLQVPAGKVITYGELAKRAGLTNGARIAGKLLSQLPQDGNLPWHRVINAQGRISFPVDSAAFQEQKCLLAQEGVEFVKDKINLSRFSDNPKNRS